LQLKATKLIPYFIVIAPIILVLIASFTITSFYLDKISNYFQNAQVNSIKEHVESKKYKSEIWVNQLNLLFDNKNKILQDDIQTELQARVDVAYSTARYIDAKYRGIESASQVKSRIVDSLSNMQWNENKNDIAISNLNGNPIALSNRPLKRRNYANYRDSDGRAIVLEEAHMAKKRGSGFLQSRTFSKKNKEIILVKNLGIYNWFISSSIHLIQREEGLKRSLLELLQSMPLDKSDFMGVYDEGKAIFLSSKMREMLGSESLDVIRTSLSKESKWHEHNIEGYYYYSTYYKPLNWHIIYGFDTSVVSQKEVKKQEELSKLLDEEVDFIIKSSASIVFLIIFVSILLSRKINSIFNTYQKEVQGRTHELLQLNESLEQRVSEEVEAHFQKQKMLVQQSKMAEMGDMLSMIAHQWRQPLNQMSYVLMNIDSAYEYDELTKEYLQDKITEGNKLLEFMSVTIDDFRNYFRPDKEQELVLVSDVVEASVELIINSLDMHEIEIELIVNGKELTNIYRNEFIQVILNLIKNAKDALVHNSVENPKIRITSTCNKEGAIVEVCDNGGGIDETILDEIFKPYFSTKDKQSGTGLGLYMSKMIIEEHLNGKLTVFNVDEGVCFRIEVDAN